jgi:hypothetical protein
LSKKKRPEPIGDVIPDFLRDAVLARWDDPVCREKWPCIHRCLEPIFEGATLRRQAGSLRLKIVGPNLIVTITNPSEILDMDFVVTSLTSAFDEVEIAISSGNFHVKPAWQKNKKKPPTILDDPV